MGLCACSGRCGWKECSPGLGSGHLLSLPVPVGMSTGHSGGGFPSQLQGQPCPEDELFSCLTLLPAPGLPQEDAEMPEGLGFGSARRDVSASMIQLFLLGTKGFLWGFQS